MEYKIYPLAITSPNWPMFIRSCQENFGFSPTRKLDDAGIKLDSTVAFHQALVGIFGADQSERLLTQTYITFLFVVDEDALVQCFDILVPLSIRYKSFDNKKLVIVSGTISSWIWRLEIGCSEFTPMVFRKLMNEIHGYLVAGGFGFAFDNYKMLHLSDGTFVLRK